MPPALRAMLLDLQAARAAARADRLLARAARPSRSPPRSPNATSLTHAPGSPSIRLNAVRDSHVALLRRPLNFEHPAACRRRAAAGRHVRAQPARRTYPATNPALTRRFRGTATLVSPPNGEESPFCTRTPGPGGERSGDVWMAGSARLAAGFDTPPAESPRLAISRSVAMRGARLAFVLAREPWMPARLRDRLCPDAAARWADSAIDVEVPQLRPIPCKCAALDHKVGGSSPAWPLTKPRLLRGSCLSEVCQL